jgi:5-methylthioribose kinase
MTDPAADLDIERSDDLIAYLRQTGRIEAGERPSTHVLAGGVSNRTVRVERETGEAWVLKQALSKLRTSVDWFASPTRIHREAAGLRWLERLAPPGSVPSFVFEDHERHLLAMQAVADPHDNWKTALLQGQVDLAHVERFGRLLGTIHRRAFERREEVAPEFEDRSFFESLRLEPYYAFTASQVPEAAGFLRALQDETRSVRVTLVHGDYSPKNVLVHAGRLVLLDHEVIHFGDPAFDLGFSLTHFLSKAHHLPPHRAAFAEAARRYVDVYRETIDGVAWEAAVEERAVRHALGCLLARVAGRSRLEYLDDGERARQRRAAARLVQAPPRTVAGLVEGFLSGLR